MWVKEMMGRQEGRKRSLVRWADRRTRSCSYNSLIKHLGKIKWMRKLHEFLNEMEEIELLLKC